MNSVFADGPDGYSAINEERIPLEIGTKVVEWDGSLTGEVTAITEPDYDYDDELQGPRLFPPKVTVAFRDGTTVEFNTTPEYKDVYSEPTFYCEEVDVCETTSST